MAGAKYRVGILGCGGTSKHFINGWAAWPDDVAVTALCDVKPEQMQKLQADFPDVCGEAATYSDYQRMLAEADLDIVCVCSFSDKHLQHTQDCLAAGKHVFVEKPIGYDLEEARKVKYLDCKYANLKGAVAYSLRYKKACMDLKALIASGTLGDIVSCEISYGHSRHWNPQDTPGLDPLQDRRPRRHFQDRGGNYIASSQLSHTTHPWDLARYLLGEVSEAFCTSRGIEIGILWMDCGALCSVLAGRMRTPSSGHMQHQIVQVHGREGSAWLTIDKEEPHEWRATYRTDGDERPAPSVSNLPDSSHGVAVRSRNLLDAIEGNAELICSLSDGARTTELLHALWLSERLQVKVPVLAANHTG